MKPNVVSLTENTKVRSDINFRNRNLPSPPRFFLLDCPPSLFLSTSFARNGHVCYLLVAPRYPNTHPSAGSFAVEANFRRPEPDNITETFVYLKFIVSALKRWFRGCLARIFGNFEHFRPDSKRLDTFINCDFLGYRPFTFP